MTAGALCPVIGRDFWYIQRIITRNTLVLLKSYVWLKKTVLGRKPKFSCSRLLYPFILFPLIFLLLPSQGIVALYSLMVSLMLKLVTLAPCYQTGHVS